MSGNVTIDENSRAYLLEISERYPTIDSALARIAALKTTLMLPKCTVHVLSDVHGEFKKLRHIINNASGGLRELVETTFGESLSSDENQILLNLIHYPRETFALVSKQFVSDEDTADFVSKMLTLEVELLRELTGRHAMATVEQVFPEHHWRLFRDIIYTGVREDYQQRLTQAVIQFVAHDMAIDILRVTAHAIRNLLVSELVVAGDLGDRGKRIDRVIDFIMRQPNVSITWGNHDAIWMGACLGHEACIANVLRVSLRYRRLSQLQEGYGILISPLEKLAREVYGDDSAGRFLCKGTGLRDDRLMAQMQKAIAIIQFKLEGQLIQRRPEYELTHRNLLHQINSNEGTVEIDGKTHSMLDTNFPTIDWERPYDLSSEEQACVQRLRSSFLQSQVLWKHMCYLAKNGSMYLRRDTNLIFHACVPVNEEGEFLPLEIDGVSHTGRAMFNVLNSVVARVFRKPETSDLDMLWYLWAGPRSPWFGKDKMATFEMYFVADKDTHRETKNPYFNLIHEEAFCEKILEEFGIETENGLIVNGHVPVKIEEGESPLKRSGKAITIDGAFSEAYGDKGYTLVLEANKTLLAQHHHFESVEQALSEGADIIPEVQTITRFSNVRTTGDTEVGVDIRAQIMMLEKLILAYQHNQIPEKQV